jgi:hypothetical protein
VSFREVWATRVAGRIGKLELDFISEELLRRNKLASGRPKELLDVALLDERPRKKRTR